MRTVFAQLDERLIECLFQPLCDLMQHRFGLTRGFAACCCLDLASLGWIMSRVHFLSDAVATWDIVMAGANLATLLLGLAALIALRMMFRRIASLGRANPLRLTMRPHRAIILLLLVSRLLQLRTPNLDDLADLAMLVCAATALYLGACAERPPVRRIWAGMADAPAG